MSIMKPAKKARALGWLAFSLALLASIPAYSASIKDTVSASFIALKKDFDKLAASKSIAKSRPGPVNALFAAALKKNPPVSSLVKVNAKGAVISEAVRGERPKKKSHRKIGREDWYVFTVKNKKAFSGTSEENGKNYLVWARPLFGGKKRVAGVVAEKIDLAGCLDLISGETTAPFLIRQEEKILYSHNWRNDSSFLEEPITIPGIEKVTFLTEKPVTVARAAEPLDISVQKVNAVPATPAQVTPEKPVLVKKAPAKISKKRVLEIIILAIVILLLIILLFRFYIWLNHKFLMHSINKPY
ncbi:MAG TPA: hypothetical protein VLX68_04545 [Chitinivibrionales bacterium]|nr:hypothetical protein [Chitinivibrionales bacterium]